MPQPPVLRPWQRAALVLAPVLVLVAFAALLLGAMLERRAQTARVQSTYDHIATLQRLRTRIVDAETGQRGYLITADSAYLEPYTRAEADVRDLLQRLHRQHGDARATVARLEQQINDRFALMKAAKVAREAGFEQARQQVIAGRGLQAMNTLRGTLRELEAQEQAQLARELDAQRAAGIYTLVVLGLGMLLVLATALFTNRYFDRHGRALERLNAELTRANDALQEQALELELQTQELQLQSAQLLENAEEIQAMNAALEQRTLEAEAANAAKTSFLRAMSHELRTPLNAIEGFSDLLQLEVQGELNPQQRASLERIRSNSRHLLVLINDILSFARLEAGRIELHVQHFGVSELFAETHAQLRPLLDRTDLKVHIEAAAPDVLVHADADRTRQILLNLLMNAVKHTGSHATVTLSARTADEQVCIDVRDDGPGIPLELQQTIFDPFVQVPQRNGTLSSGVGLGLSISRALARSMGGDLTLESTPGQGACFRITLPRSIAVEV